AVGSGLKRRSIEAVRGVNLAVTSGRTVALVGESGSGKSTIARIIAQLETPTSGEITLDGVPISRGGRGLRQYRSDVQMVFQDPFASLNPYHVIGHHIERPLQIHQRDLSSDQVSEEMESLLGRVGLHPVERFVSRRPHELSGGQRQ